MTRIITWNVNSVRKRIDHLCSVLSENEIDVAVLQEIKCTDDQFPYSELGSLGYSSYVHGQKSRNGVAIVSRLPIKSDKIVSDNIFHLCGNMDVCDVGSYSIDEARYIECAIEINGREVRVISVYVPNGQEVDTSTFEYKLRFLECLKVRLLNLLDTNDLLIVGGDYNVAPENIDVYDHELLNGRLCFHIKERSKFREILNAGFIDAFRSYAGEDKQEFSWWNYREGAWNNNKGMRIDGFILSPQVADLVQDCHVLSQVRGWESPSDHAPVICDIGSISDGSIG